MPTLRDKSNISPVLVPIDLTGGKNLHCYMRMSTREPRGNLDFKNSLTVNIDTARPRMIRTKVAVLTRMLIVERDSCGDSCDVYRNRKRPLTYDDAVSTVEIDDSLHVWASVSSFTKLVLSLHEDN